MKSLPDSIIKTAQKMYGKYNVFASVQIAQWMDESNFGADMPTGSNNPFGIKAVPGQPYVISLTTEQSKDGSIEPIHAMFRRFNSIDDAFDAHAKLLATGTYFKPIAKYLNTDPLTYIDRMAPIYATSLTYAEALKMFIKEYNLTQYDIKPKPLPIVGIAGTVTVAAATSASVIAKAPHTVHMFDFHNLLYTAAGLPLGFLLAVGIGAAIYFADRKAIVGIAVPLQTKPDFGVNDMAILDSAVPVISQVASLAQVANTASVAEASLTQVASSLTDVNTSLSDVSTSLTNVVSSMQQNDTDTVNGFEAAANGQ